MDERIRTIAQAGEGAPESATAALQHTARGVLDAEMAVESKARKRG